MGRTPHTFNRAATAVVHSWRELEKAADEVRLALEILSGLPIGDGISEEDRLVLLSRLEGYLTRLEALRVEGRRAWVRL